MSTATDLLTTVKATLTEQTNQANSIVSRIQAAKAGQSGNLVHEIALEQPTDDATVLEARARIEKIDAAREQTLTALYDHVKANLMPASDEAVDVEALTAEYKALKASIAAGLSFLGQVVPGGIQEDTLADVPALQSLRGGTVGKSGAAGDTKRPRIHRVWLDGEAITTTNAKGATVSNLTTLATHLSKLHKTKVEVKDLQMHAFAAAGTDDFKTLNGKVFEFSINIGDKSHTVKIEPSVVAAKPEAQPAK